jgi:hypothetical protein
MSVLFRDRFVKLLEVLQKLVPVIWRDFTKDFSDIGLVIWSYFAPDPLALFGDNQDDLPALIGIGALSVSGCLEPFD